MLGQVGYWGSCQTGGLAIGFNREMLDWLDRENTDRKVLVQVTRERKVVVMPSFQGCRVAAHSTAERVATPFKYISSGLPKSLTMGLDLPLFELFSLNFKKADGCLQAQLPEDYDLPWPRLRVNCTTYEAEKLALEALQWRMNALVASGKTSLPGNNRMPSRLLQLLPKGAFAECVRTAKALSGQS